MILRRILPFVFSFALVVALALHSGISMDSFVASVAQVGFTTLVGIMLATGVFLALSTLKWKMVMARLRPDDEHHLGWAYGFHCTALGAVLSLVVSPQVAMVIARTYGDKVKLGKPAAPTTAATLFEQLFDVLPIFALAATALLANVLGWSARSWLLVTAGAVVVCGPLAALVLQTPFWSIGRIVPGPLGKTVDASLQWFATPGAQALFEPGFVLEIYAISVIRYLVLMARAYLIFAPMQLSLTDYGFGRAYSIVSVSRVLLVTPGGLGITEWSWTGILGWLGMPLKESVRFVLANRVVNTLSIILIFLLVYPLSPLGRTRERKAGLEGRRAR